MSSEFVMIQSLRDHKEMAEIGIKYEREHLSDLETYVEVAEENLDSAKKSLCEAQFDRDRKKNVIQILLNDLSRTNEMLKECGKELAR